jgi:hypothetical protein
MIVPDNDREPWQAHTLRAWQEAFGTTQLTHAKARLERAEDHMRRVEEAEARCCPEDVGFEEWIGVLKKRLDEALRASPPEAVEREVWAVEGKTTFVLFANKEAAYAYLAGFPASVGGGMEMVRMPVLAYPPNRSEGSK